MKAVTVSAAPPPWPPGPRMSVSRVPGACPVSPAGATGASRACAGALDKPPANAARVAVIRAMKRLSGDFLYFCPECSGACETAQIERTSRKTLFTRIAETIRLPRKK